jgi:hypothetical protein
MKAKDFLIVRRLKLAKITKHPAIGFAKYERRLNSGQSVLHSIKQVYLGARERAVSECGCHHALLEDTVAKRQWSSDRATSTLAFARASQPSSCLIS